MIRSGRAATDAEIVELAAYLHDLVAIGDITAVSKHHLLGASLALQVLQQHNCPSEWIERVARCITSHSAPVQIGNSTLEEVCVSNADAMSQIARPVYWLHYAFRVRQFDFETGRGWYRQQVDSSWSQWIPQARDMIEQEYRSVRDLLKEPG